MLQVDPNKRIPLSKVLEHKWMTIGSQKVLDGGTALHKSCGSSSSSSSGSLVWNEHVLMALQRYNCNVEICKQVRVSCHIIVTYCTCVCVYVYVYVYVQCLQQHLNLTFLIVDWEMYLEF